MPRRCRRICAGNGGGRQRRPSGRAVRGTGGRLRARRAGALCPPPAGGGRAAADLLAGERTGRRLPRGALGPGGEVLLLRPAAGGAARARGRLLRASRPHRGGAGERPLGGSLGGAFIRWRGAGSASWTRGENALFYEESKVLTAARYRAWLSEEAVSYVALPDYALDYSGGPRRGCCGEGSGSGRRGTTEAARGRAAGLSARSLALCPLAPVRGARCAATRAGAGDADRDDDGFFTLNTPRTGTFTVRIHFTPYWALREVLDVSAALRATGRRCRREGRERLAWTSVLARAGVRSRSALRLNGGAPAKARPGRSTRLRRWSPAPVSCRRASCRMAGWTRCARCCSLPSRISPTGSCARSLQATPTPRSPTPAT